MAYFEVYSLTLPDMKNPVITQMGDIWGLRVNS